MDIANIALGVDTRDLKKGREGMDKLKRSGTDAERRLNVATRSMAGGFSLVRGAIFSAAAAYSASRLIKLTADFSQSVADLSAITGATGADLEYYADQAKDIGATTSLSASQASQAFKLIASAKPDLLGSAESLNEVTRSAVTLAEATGIDLPAAAQALGASLNQFQLDAESADEVINILAASSQLGTAEVSAVTEALRNAGAAANSLGLDLTETVAGIQALAASGRQGADAGTALRQVMLRLEQTGDRDLMPSINGLSRSLNTLADRNLNNTELMELFGQEAFTAAASLLSQREVLEKLNGTLRGTNTAYEQASIRMDTLVGDFKNLNSAIEGLTLEVLGGDLEELQREGVQGLTEKIRELTLVIGYLGDEMEDSGSSFSVFSEYLKAQGGPLGSIITGFDLAGKGWDALIEKINSEQTEAATQKIGAFSEMVGNLTNPMTGVPYEPMGGLGGPGYTQPAANDSEGTGELPSPDGQNFDALLYSDMQAEVEEKRLQMLEDRQAEELVMANDHAQMLLDVERARLEMVAEMDEAERQRKMEKYGLLLNTADAYFAGMEGKEAAYARASLSIARAAFSEKGRMQLADLWNDTRSAAMGAYEAMASIPIIGPALGAAAAAGVIAYGAMQAGQMVQSFEGGGFTGAGSRSGGMDGKGGFPAMLHPNEVVYDLTKSRAMNDSGGNATYQVHVSVDGNMSNAQARKAGSTIAREAEKERKRQQRFN
jgi:hypothetical protein